MRASARARARYYWSLLWGAGTMIAGIVSLVGLLDTITAHLPARASASEGTWHLLHLSVSWWLFLVVLSLLTAVFEKSYRLRSEQNDRLHDREVELAASEAAGRDATAILSKTLTQKEDEIKSLRNALDDKKPHPEAHIEAVYSGMAGEKERPSIMLVLSIYNTGAPTILRGWTLTIEHSGTQFHPNLTESAEVSLPVDEANSTMRARFGIQDFIHRKTATPIPTGGMAQGFMVAVIPEQEAPLFLTIRKMPGITYKIGFSDVLSILHEAVMVSRGEPGPMMTYAQIKTDISPN